MAERAQLPQDDQRHVIIGRTGSGKTQAGIHSLSLRSYTTRPWLVYNFKQDKLIDSIPRARHIGIEELPPPGMPGIYVVHPKVDAYDELESSLLRAWEQQETGIYIDEGYMLAPIGKINTPFRMLLTQGRSRLNPVIVLSQKPSWIDRFVFSESEFIQVFALQDTDDQKTIFRFMPKRAILSKLRKYESYLYRTTADDDDPNALVKVAPVPDRDIILSTFDRRLEQLEKKPEKFKNPFRVI